MPRPILLRAMLTLQTRQLAGKLAENQHSPWTLLVQKQYSSAVTNTPDSIKWQKRPFELGGTDN